VIDFNETDFERTLSELVLKTPAPGKHCARNSINHIKKANIIADIDKEMSAFRAITAEEEGASAIFYALRRRKYEYAEKLKPRDHRQKNAFAFLLGAVFKEFNETLGLKFRYKIDTTTEHYKLKLILNFESNGLNIQNEPPLDVSVKINGVPHNFSEPLQRIAESNKSKVDKIVDERQNRRNRLLYASQQGIPAISSLNDFLIFQRELVYTLICFYLLIDQYSEKQSFAQQLVESLLILTSQFRKK
jgi:hypothetical protein